MKQQANQTHKELLQERFDHSEFAYREAGELVSGFQQHVANARREMAVLEGDYASACRTVASGGAADPAAILANKNSRQHRLVGLQALLRDATERLHPLHAAQEEAARALQNELNREEIERLEGALVDAKQERTKAQAGMDAAHRAVSKASYDLDQFLRKIQIAKKQAQLVAQGRA